LDRSLQRVNRGDEPVAYSRQCLDVPWVVGRIAENCPQLLDGAIQPVFEVDERIRRPQPVLQLVPRYNLFGTFEKDDEDGERLSWQPDPNTVFPQLAPGGIQFEHAEAHDPIHREHPLAALKETAEATPVWSPGPITRMLLVP
jgi:hypothetical protein